MKKMLMIVAFATALVSCGGGGGRPSFGDNEYPVVTVGTSSADMQTTYPAMIKGVQDVEIRPKVQLAQAQAALASAREMLSFCYVKSPATGVVGTLPFKKGALVSASNALTTVSNISSMEVYFSVTEKFAMEMTRNGEGLNSLPPVKLQLSDGTIYAHEGKVTKMSGVIDQATGTVQLIAVFTNPEKLLKSGGAGTIIIPRQATSAIIIPQSCVSEVQNKKFVYTLGKDNKVVYTEIKVDPQNDGNNYIVTDGLKTGDKYVTNGITKLSDGMEIVPITPERYQQKIDEQAKAMSAGDIVGAMKK